MSVHVLGVRHHGPGSARSVRAALEAIQPDAVLVEGPADADDLLRFVGQDDLVPPVALLASVVDSPKDAVFWPFAAFSPEWQAIRWARAHEVPVRFCDLPSGAVLASRAEPSADPDPDATSDAGAGGPPAGGDGSVPDPSLLRADPLAALADAAGYDDPERWWEDLIEHRGLAAGDPLGPFAALTQAMAAVREHAGPGREAEQQLEDRREAHMRQIVRATRVAGAQRIAVVCGAWHGPALVDPLPAVGKDAALLRGLARRRTAVTWVPYTHSRLAFASGYGAGVTSPGWYQHLFTAADRPITRWFTAVARELRTEDLPVSSAHVIEAVRLADTLAVLHDRPLAGLAEVTEATRAVLCEGDDTMLDLVVRRLVVGEALGRVPDTVPTVPLAADVEATARRLRLKRDAGEKALDLDLRNATDLDRSRLLHRLALLEVPWGRPATSDVRSKGTFRETWALRWRPELSVALVVASLYGTTVASAASARVEQDAASAPDLAGVTRLLEAALLADLPHALPGVLGVIDVKAAADLDVVHLMTAMPALIRALRYGDVRGTDTTAIAHVADVTTARICAALPAAVSGLDDEAADQLDEHVSAVHAALVLREDAGVRGRWLDVLAGLADRADLHGLLAGRVTRLLRDDGRFSPVESGRRLGLALSRAVPPPEKAAWVEGFLGGGGLLLAHDPDLLALIDAWVCGLADHEFTDVLPLLRRTFATFERGARQVIGDQVARGVSPAAGLDAGPNGTGAGFGAGDESRAAPAVALAAWLLGGGGRP